MIPLCKGCCLPLYHEDPTECIAALQKETNGLDKRIVELRADIESIGVAIATVEVEAQLPDNAYMQGIREGARRCLRAVAQIRGRRLVPLPSESEAKE